MNIGLHQLQAQRNNAGVVHQTESENQVGNDIEGVHHVDQRTGHRCDRFPRNAPVIAVPVIADHRKHQLDVGAEARQFAAFFYFLFNTALAVEQRFQIRPMHLARFGVQLFPGVFLVEQCHREGSSLA